MAQLNGKQWQALYEGLFEMVDCSVWEWDLQTLAFRANDQWRAYHPHGMQKTITLEDITRRAFDSPEDVTRFMDFMDGVETFCSIPYINQGGYGGKHKGVRHFFMLRDEEGRPLRLISAAAEHLDGLPFSYDSITHLPDRRSMLSLVERAVHHPSGLFQQNAFLVIDPDHFRQINENYGYSTGDLVLQDLTRRLESLRSERIFLSRGESNNFMLLFQDLAHADELEWILKRIMSLFEAPFPIGPREIRMTVSVGAVAFYSESSSVEDVLNSAFIALRRAKEHTNFTNSYAQFNQSMLVDLQQREHIMQALDRHQENHCLYLHYQPQINTQDGSLHAFEALLRLQCPETGSVPPNKFIPIAEETGQIIDIGYWVLRECCHMIQRLRHADVPFTTVAVNISLVQLMSDQFVPRVQQIIQEAGVPPSSLEFEITESVLMNSVDVGASLLRKLKKFGINITLDDFGMEYSSLNYIRALCIDTLKIDKVFIDNICQDSKSHYIVEMIVNMARQLGLEVVAEGVESREQLEELRRMFCPIIQGFYYSRPLSEEGLFLKYAPQHKPSAPLHAPLRPHSQHQGKQGIGSATTEAGM